MSELHRFSFLSKVYRQTVGIPMGTNCAPLVADCYERYFTKSLSQENQVDSIEAFNSTSRFLGDLLNIDNIYFEHMVDRIYPAELQLNKANSSDTEAQFLDFSLSISNGTVSSKIFDKRDDFDIVISRFSTVKFLGAPRMECTYLSLFVSLEHLLT